MSSQDYKDEHMLSISKAPDDFGEDFRFRKTAEEYRRERARRAEEHKHLRLNKLKKKRIIIPICAVIAVLILAISADYLVSLGKIHGNVEVMGIAVGGKTRTDAKRLLEERIAEYSSQPIEVKHDELSWEISPESIGLSCDVQGAVDNSWRVGRSRNVFVSLRDRFLCWFRPAAVALDCAGDPELMEAVFAPLREAINVASVDSSVVFENEFVVVPGSDGVLLNEGELIVRISDAMFNQQDSTKAPAEIDERVIDDEGAAIAARTANAARVKPVVVTYNDKSWTLDEASIAQLIEFKRSDGLEATDAVMVSEESTEGAKIWLAAIISAAGVREKVIPKVGAEVGTAPVDAAFSVEGGVVRITPSQTGSGVDAPRLAADLAGVLLLPEEDKRHVNIFLNELEPALTTEKAQALGIRDRISTYNTTFSSGNAARVNNIKLLSQSLNGALIAPGEEFSFNDRIGPRTAAKGYQEAGAIVNGEIVNQIGGGICQVNTTLFNTALLAGVDITQRKNHSTFLSSYPAGRDATVSWGGPDFKFKNSLDYYILIATAASNTSVTVSFYGVDPGYTISLSTDDFVRTDFDTKEVSDPNLDEGSRVVEVSGQRGGTITLTQVVKKGNEVVRTQTFGSRYRTVTEVVRVGTRKVSVPPAGATPSATQP